MKLRNLLSIAMIAFLAIGISSCGSDEASGPSLTYETAKKSFFIKASGTRCPPCGGWGWDVNSEVMNAYGTDIVAFTAYGDFGGLSESFVNGTATTLLLNFERTGGIPYFSVNGKMIQESNSSNMRANIDAFNAGTAAAQVAISPSIEGMTVTAEIGAKLVDGTPSDHYVAAYLVESGPSAFQSGHPDGANTVHKNVLRGAFHSTAWGTQMTTNELIETVTFDLNSPSVGTPAINRANDLKVVVAVYKLNGSTYEYVNGNIVEVM